MLNLENSFKASFCTESEGSCNIVLSSFQGVLMRFIHNRPNSSLLLLTERIKQHASQNPFKIALRNELGEEISYGNFYRIVGAVGEGLRRSGAKSVGILCKDPIQMAIGIFGAWFGNCIAVPLRKSFNKN